MFELWIDEAPIKGGGFVLATSKCFARRTLEEVRSEFHDMKVGDIRNLSEDCWVVRVA